MRRASLRAWLAGLLAALAAGPLAGAAGPLDGQAETASELLAALDRAEPGDARALATRIVRLGQDAALAAVDPGEFASRDLRARRARSWVLLQGGGDGCIDAAIPLLDDEDTEVRRNALSFLSDPERQALPEQRARAIERTAAGDPDTGVALAALQALARIDHPRATESLARLMDELVPPVRGLAAAAFASQGRARQQVVERVQASFAREAFTLPVPDDVLRELLGVYGERLAELPQGGTTRRDRVPFVHGVRHPSPDVRLVAGLALDRFVSRLRVMGDIERLEACLAALIGEGLDDAGIRRLLTTIDLEEGEDPSVALASARELRARTSPSVGGLVERSRHAEATLMEAAALIALGRGREADEPLDAAERTLAGLIAQRLDLRGSDRLEAVQASLLEMQVQVELYRAARLLALDLEFDDPRVLERVRSAHERALEAHLVLLQASGSSTKERLDRILGGPLSPFTLLFSNPRNPQLERSRALELEHLLCRALATVAPAELPGFEPGQTLEPRLAGPLADPPRHSLLQQIQGQVYRQREDLIEQLRQQARRDPENIQLQLDIRTYEMMFRDERKTDEKDGAAAYLRLRRPSSYALVVGARLREDGSFAAGRIMAQKVVEDLRALETTGAVSQRTFQDSWELEILKARADMSVGNGWMDEDQSDVAEETMLAAVERLEVLEATMADQGASAGAIARVEVLRADALVSLAVNANVKQRHQEQAVAYFERAWELREDDFMRVLLACYRARAGRDLEARDVLRDVPVIPANYYNLACTYALLGEDELALDFLRRDFEEMRPTPGALARQKEWAKEDPDLESLWSDPRFEDLVRDVGE